jgi:hypothetical protein
MANASNAYATINPVRTNIGDTIQGIEKMDFAYRDEQRQIDAIEQARKEKEQAKKDKLREKMMGQIPKNYDTGSSSLNEFQAKIIQQGVNRLGEIYKELNNPNLNEDDRIKLEIEAQNIDDLPNNLKISTDNFSKQINDYKTGIANGSIFRNPDFEKKVLNGFENYVGTLQNGLPAVGFVDRNEDGTVNNLDVLPYDKLQQGIGNWSFQKQFDLDAMAIDAAKKVGYDDITTDNNFKSVQEKKAKISSVESVATNLLQNPDGTPTDVALSQMKKMGIEPNEQSLKQVKDYFMQRVLANTDYTKKENVDYSAQTGRMSEIRQANEDEKDKPTWNVVETPPSYSQAKQKSASGYQTVAINGKTNVPAIEFYNKSTNKKETITNGQIQSYTVVTDSNGKRSIVAEIVHTDTKSRKSKESGKEQGNKTESIENMATDSGETRTTGEEKVITVVPLTQAQSDIFSKQLGFKNTNEMKDAARVSKTQSSNTSSTNKKTIEGF